jgi:outer membrane protein assembly factor BamB
MPRFLVMGVFLGFGPALLWADDWPQWQHDAGRSGYTADGPRPPFQHAWNYDFITQEHDKIHPVVQAIVYEGKVLVPSKTGRVHAVDAATGEKVWKWEQAGPIVNSVGCAAGLVIFGSLDGRVYAVRAADGSPVWQFAAGIRGFCTAPCLADGKLFMGARDGTFYCLEIKTGKKLWATPTGGFVWHTAAYADGRVFVGNEELKVLCLDARDGRVLWKTGRLTGFTFRDGHAFVDQGKVVVRTWSAIDDTDLRIDKASIKTATDAGTYLAIPAALQDKALEALHREPELRQELYVLDARTGKELYMPVHSGRVSTVDGPAFSVCRDGPGNWYLPVYAGPIAADWGSTMAFARMDPQTGRLRELLWTPKCKPASNDEAHALSVGGDILYVSEQEEGEAGIFCAFDLKEPLKIDIPTPHMHWDMEYNAQPLANPIAVAGDRFYRVTNHILRCWVGDRKEKRP